MANFLTINSLDEAEYIFGVWVPAASDEHYSGTFTLQDTVTGAAGDDGFEHGGESLLLQGSPVDGEFQLIDAFTRSFDGSQAFLILSLANGRYYYVGSADEFTVTPPGWTGAVMEYPEYEGDGSDNNWQGAGKDNSAKGLGGNDTLDGGNGADTLDGGDGNDSLQGGSTDSAVDSLLGGDGNDTLDGGGGEADVLEGGAGNDTYIVHNTANDLISDFSGIDTVLADFTDYTLGAGLENLTLSAGEGTPQSGTGNALDNVITGVFGDMTGASFTLSGLDGNDTLVGARFADTLLGGNGNDSLSGGGGRDALWAGSGDDVLAGGTGNDSLGGGTGHDTAFGGAGHDALYGSDGNDSLAGDDGNDSLWGDLGDDTVVGGAGNDSLEGKDGVDLLRGGIGSDTLLGGNDNDTLVGGWGSDSLSGQGGADTFLFQADFTSGADTVTDFVAGTDVLQVAKWLTNITNTGALWAERLAFGIFATEADDRFIFDGATGNLYYDADGSNAGAQVLVVTLSGVTSLAAGEIVIV